MRLIDKFIAETFDRVVPIGMVVLLISAVFFIGAAILELWG